MLSAMFLLSFDNVLWIMCVVSCCGMFVYMSFMSNEDNVVFLLISMSFRSLIS
jgi:hypothetical protein